MTLTNSHEGVFGPSDDLYLAVQRMMSDFKLLVVPEYEKAAAEYAARGQYIAASIVSHVARRISSVTTLTGFAETLTEVDDLTKWLPLAPDFRGLDPGLRKLKVIEFVKGSDLDEDSKSFCIKNLVRPGRPAETRFAAIEALELHEQGFGWPEIEQRLVPHRRHVINSGRSIDREVELLQKTLRRYEVKIAAR